jgi:protein gp37
VAENTTIAWCDDTFSPWWGCTKVSPGCANCYAEGIANRFAPGSWGPQGTRRLQTDSYWQKPLAWDKRAARAGARRRVFCASVADVFEDRPELAAPRRRLFLLIGETRNLDWLLLTKRPENLARMVPPGPWPNVWLGVSVEDQARADERIPHLLAAPAAVRFLSCEPLLSAVDLSCYLARLDWVIAGGESGPGARPFLLEWAESLRDQCAAAAVAFFLKQVGRSPQYRGEAVVTSDGKGGDPDEWPEGLRVRQFPT